MKPVVFAKIPKTGLGNCMFVWAHALVFARINHLELVTSRWSRFRWGAILRSEKKNRRYAGYFKEVSYFRWWYLRFVMLFNKIELDPAIEKIQDGNRTRFFVFTKPYPRRELFKYLEPYEDLIREEIYKLLSPRLQEKLLLIKSPQIAIHVRRGDFKIANPITPNKFFISAISNIRSALNQDLAVTVFTDAEDNEIADILSMEHVSLSTNEEDILDLLQMSKSKFLVLSRSSTFSYWAAFLSEGLVIMHVDDWQKQIKPWGEKYFEMRYDGQMEMDYGKILTRHA